MSTKTLIWICLSVGSIVGGYIPALWGDNMLSYASLISSGIGGITGIFIAIKRCNATFFGLIKSCSIITFIDFVLSLINPNGDTDTGVSSNRKYFSSGFNLK